MVLLWELWLGDRTYPSELVPQPVAFPSYLCQVTIRILVGRQVGVGLGRQL